MLSRPYLFAGACAGAVWVCLFMVGVVPVLVRAYGLLTGLLK